MSKFSTTIPFQIANTFGSQQPTPDVDKKNPLDAKTFINSIELTFDPAFQLKGRVQVVLNDGFIAFDSLVAGFFRRYATFSIPLANQSLDRQGHVKIFAWNGLNDGSAISASGTMIISDTAGDLSKPNVPSTTPLMSDGALLFAYQIYAVGDYYEPFDFLGYKNAILFLSGAAYVPPIKTETNVNNCTFNAIGGSTLNGDVDGILTTWQGDSLNNGAGSAEGYKILDFGSIANRIFSMLYTQPAGNNSQGTITVSWSTDGVNYFQITQFTLALNDNVQHLFQDASRSIRYIKVDFKMPALGVFDIEWFEFYDAAVFGGTASLSIQGFDIASQSWQDTILGSDIGTVSSGNFVTAQIGSSMQNTAKLFNRLLASNSALVRAHLNISGNGSLKTGASVIRVST